MGSSLLEPLGGSRPAPDGFDDRSHDGVDRILVQVVAEAQHVGARRERAHRSVLDAAPALIARISSASVTTSPSKPSSSRRRPVRIRGLSVAGCVVERAHEQCPRHHRAYACRDRGAERQQRGVEVAVDDGQLVVRVDRGVAVAGEVLGARGDALALRPATNAATCRATSSGSAPKLRTPITGLSGFVFTSATGARFMFTPTAASSPGDRGRDRRGQREVVDDARARSCPGYELPDRGLEPRDVAALLVDRDEEPRRVVRAATPSAPQAARGRGRCGEEQTPPSPPSSHGSTQSGRLVAGEARRAGRRRPAAATSVTD